MKQQIVNSCFVCYISISIYVPNAVIRDIEIPEIAGQLCMGGWDVECMHTEMKSRYTYVCIFPISIFFYFHYSFRILKNKDSRDFVSLMNCNNSLKSFSSLFIHSFIHSLIFSFFQWKNYSWVKSGLARTIFVLRVDLPMSRDIFGFHSLERTHCYRPLVGRGQRCY